MRDDLKDKVAKGDILEVRPKYRGWLGASIEVMEVVTNGGDVEHLPWYTIMTTDGIVHRWLSHEHFCKRRTK